MREKNFHIEIYPKKKQPSASGVLFEFYQIEQREHSTFDQRDGALFSCNRKSAGLVFSVRCSLAEVLEVHKYTPYVTMLPGKSIISSRHDIICAENLMFFFSFLLRT